MNRRKFLEGMIAAGLAAAIDVDKLLWVPGAKTISIPPPAGLAFHKEAFSMAAIDLPISIRFLRSYDIDNMYISRFDARVLWVYGYDR